MPPFRVTTRAAAPRAATAETVAAARLMGADCIISGIRPQIAQTIVHLGVDLGAEVDEASGAIRFGGKTVIARTYPIGIDWDHFQEQGRTEEAHVAEQRLLASTRDRTAMIGVDRLDYSKGLPERFRAFERHLERYPEQRGHLTFLQIAPPSRGEAPEYQSLRRELEGLSGHINGLHAAPDWTPVRYVNRNFNHDVLTGFYRVADIGLVTPLRDGMNLVAKEFIAAQDPEDPGVLVLSRFAGAASEMTEALQVNPYDLDGVADAIARAFDMPLAERRERWRTMMDYLERHDINAWRRGYLGALAAA